MVDVSHALHSFKFSFVSYFSVLFFVSGGCQPSPHTPFLFVCFFLCTMNSVCTDVSHCNKDFHKHPFGPSPYPKVHISLGEHASTNFSCLRVSFAYATG